MFVIKDQGDVVSNPVLTNLYDSWPFIIVIKQITQRRLYVNTNTCAVVYISGQISTFTRNSRTEWCPPVTGMHHVTIWHNKQRWPKYHTHGLENHRKHDIPQSIIRFRFVWVIRLSDPQIPSIKTSLHSFILASNASQSHSMIVIKGIAIFEIVLFMKTRGYESHNEIAMSLTKTDYFFRTDFNV